MQRLKTLFLLSLFLSTALPAQNRLHIEHGTHMDTKRISYGIEMETGMMKYHIIHYGKNSNYPTIKADYPPSLALGIHGVATYRILRCMQLYTSPGLMFSDGTFHWYGMGESTENEREKKSCFLDIPIGLKIYGTRMTNVRPTINVGGGYMFLLSNEQDSDEDISQGIMRLKKHHMYITAGVGVDIYSPHIKISPSIKYIRSVSDAAVKDKDPLSLWTITVKNMYISGIFFSIRFQ